MTWRNVKLVFGRELRDQLRDRRTLFMVAVLPVLLYPLLGISFFQISQFMQDKPSRVLVVGARELGDPPLFENNRFAADLFLKPEQARDIEIVFARSEGRELSREEARRAVLGGQYDAALYFPPGFADRLEAFREAIRRGEIDGSDTTDDLDLESEADEAPIGENTLEIPSPEVIHSTATERSQLAVQRLQPVIREWLDRVGERNLAAKNLSPKAVRPFQVRQEDVAENTGLRGAVVWSKILPVLLVVWTLTGAFYPAVDLCAGEKERGTLETLLSSPARRSEIVLGKLGAVMVFSMVTAALNLVSMGITGVFAFSQMGNFGRPPLLAVVWLALALPPAAAVFSALALAIAAFARSTKEGQYYLMPLLFVTLPLVGLPVAQRLELNLGNSLIPVTGLVLLLKNLIEGNYAETLPYVLPVSAVTLAGVYFSVRWAVEQFNSENALFRGGERLELGPWLKYAFARREATPTLAAAVACGLVIIFLRFFATNALGSWAAKLDFVQIALLTQLGIILPPVLLMTFAMTSSPRKTLLLRLPSWWAIPAAVGLALLLHPAVLTLQQWVMRLYPMNPKLQAALQAYMLTDIPLWRMLLVVAATPALVEELTYRGFILSGARRMRSQWHAVLLASFFFAAGHSILQQAIIAFFVGLVIGWLAVKTDSLWPCMAFHFTHNALGVLWSRASADWFLRNRWVEHFVLFRGGEILVRWPVVMASFALAILILYAFRNAAKSRRRALRAA
ncbi:MAG: CPBP family intramembrane metalloprotease [Planctomycetota bacterium]|nr:MAG: CPBP family intramembrane metalloprotease [Planctomycetota bacterium]